MDVMTLIYLFLLGVLLGFIVRVYQTSGAKYFIGTFLGSAVLLPIIYITVFFGAIPAIYFARQKRDILIKWFIQIVSQSNNNILKNKENVEAMAKEYWTRLCLYAIFTIWKSLDTISCAGINCVAEAFREKQPMSELKNTFREAAHHQREVIIDSMSTRLTKLQRA